MVSFSIQSVFQEARVGELHTSHGVIETPAFLFCATKGTLKGVAIQDIKAQGIQILLANTYHLMVQPGADLIEQMGGLHRFMGWDGPLFTDSGGYQIFSLGHGSVSDEIKGKRNRPKTLTQLTEEGACFKSYTDGRKILLTPEQAIHIQHQLGTDLMCVLDECTPFHVPFHYTEVSMERSHRWAERSLKAFQLKNNVLKHGLYGIVQGGVYPDLRKRSAEFIQQHPFFGHAIGGSLGATKAQMHDVVAMTMSHLRSSQPVHLLGIGGLEDIYRGVLCGVDTFDCVSPTRLGRHGGALITRKYWEEAQETVKNRSHINLLNTVFKKDPNPIDSECPCPTCQSYSRAYLHHLFKARELLGLQALTLHNMVFMHRYMAALRQGIKTKTLSKVGEEWLPPFQ